jgi:hypothetical protein
MSGAEIDEWLTAREQGGGGRTSDTSWVPLQLNAGAAVLSFSVFADSMLGHYHGGFFNPVMYVGPTVSALTLAASTAAATRPGAGRIPESVFGVAAVTGVVGSGFHSYNVGRRVGGWSWGNLFYGAPIGAPLGLTFAGLFGLAGARLAKSGNSELLGYSAGPLLASLAAVGLLGTAGEAGLLHFRGAFHNPFMYIPVTIPPLAAAVLGLAVLGPTPARRKAARALLGATLLAGLAGMGFHAYGIQRNMGGWYNWSQNLLNGPPLPAPPSFTGMALAGLAGLSLVP